MFEKSLPEVLVERAGKTPDRIFLESVTGWRATYAEVLETSLRWAAAWRRSGVDSGDRVALFVPPSPDYILCWIGLTWLRAVEVGVNPDYRGEMLKGVIRDSGASSVLVHSTLLPHVVDIQDDLPALERIVVVDQCDLDPFETSRVPVVSVASFLDGAAPLEVPRPPQPWDIASICYTSGTTGPSKGVMLPWGQIQHLSHRIFEGLITEDDAFYSPLPLFHLGGKNFPLLMASRGGRLVMRERFSATAFWSDIKRTESTFTVLVGTMASLLLKQPARHDDADNPLSLLWSVPVFERIGEFRERFGIDRVMTSYTQTEMGATLLNQTVTKENWTSAGRPVEGVDVAIVDEHDIPVPTGDVGQLVVRTREPWRLNAGYFGRPEATADAWRNGWYHTGDAFRADDEGWYYFVDRLKDCVRRSGENISSLEVERHVDVHPEVQASACVGVPSDLGEEDVRIFVQRVEGSALAHRDLFDYLAETMPRFMVPRYIEFVDTVPKTANQRVQKAGLRERPLGPATWDREAHGIRLARRPGT